MKKFDIPEFYRSPIISEVKSKRKIADPRKKDFTPSLLPFDTVDFWIARHFGFCYGVENAIEISYKAISENPNKRIFLLSQMIHNPGVNDDLQGHGIQFLQDTSGKQLIPFESLTEDDVVIIPAFGTSVEIMNQLNEIGVQKSIYNTTCPFVEKVWNRAEKLGQDEHTIIIHGKYNHEETRATFSHSRQNAPSLVVKNMKEAEVLGQFILGEIDTATFNQTFAGKYSDNFSPKDHLDRIGVVNQTTMLATETQEITDYLRSIMIQKFGEAEIKNHIADTRDTLCYATNDNQSATSGLLEVDADFAIVVGGYNSSNTTHLVEMLEEKFPTFFIKDENSIDEAGQLSCFDIHQQVVIEGKLPMKDAQKSKIIITSGASCPDATVDRVIQKILELSKAQTPIEQAIENLVF
ncbi:MAG: 4-hydroxy-3-methylbut-2-enyl diphosphate reductase [Crocinitomicaceae bacterium]|jgi:4-hydroxy-3-methylbut-2-enyl diphosphate reductase|nr:4-hydroxy-3-methylbut-2-enyl diphosphate reductase [Crocinitomicaceae bacterium]